MPIAGKPETAATRLRYRALARPTRAYWTAPQLSLTGGVTLSQEKRRSALAGRTWNFPAPPQLSLTDSVMLSRTGADPLSPDRRRITELLRTFRGMRPRIMPRARCALADKTSAIPAVPMGVT